MSSVIIDEVRRKAIKEHKCNYCGKTIQYREKYTDAKVVEDGCKIYSWKQCDRCTEFTKEAFENKNYYFKDDGMSQEDFVRYMREENPSIAEEWWGKVKKNKTKGEK